MATATKKQPQKSNNGTLMLVGISVAIVAIGILVIVLFTGSDSKPDAKKTSTAKEYQSSTITGTLAGLPESGADPEVGKTAPTVVGKDFAGNTVNLIEKGKPELIVFLAHWCPHCNAEAPLIVDWMAKGGNKGVDVIGVTTGSDEAKPNWPPSEWIANLSWAGRVMTDSQDAKIATAYGLPGYPYLIFVDANGKVTKRMSGEQPIADIQAAIDQIAPASTPAADAAK